MTARNLDPYSSLPSQPGRQPVVLVVILGTFTVALNNSAFNVVVPELMSVFQVGALTAGWVVNLFLIMMAMTMPVTGYLSDRFGLKPVYLFGLAAFLLSSLLGVVITGLTQLLVLRALQGIAAGIMIPLSLPLMFRQVGISQRGKLTGVWGMAIMLAPAMGPAVGGYLIDAWHWRMLFLISLPTAFVSLLLGCWLIPATVANHQRSFDVGGFLLSVGGVAALLIGLNEFSRRPEISSPGGLLVCAGLALLGSFIYWSLRRREPLLSLAILQQPVYALSVLISCVQAMITFGCLLLLPLWMIQVQGFSALQAGLVFLPAALSCSLAVRYAGQRIDYQSAWSLIVLGLLLTSVAMVGLALLPENSAIGWLYALMMLRGVGVGFSYIPAMTLGLNALADEHSASASALNNIMRRLFAALAVAGLCILYDWMLKSPLSDVIETGAGKGALSRQAEVLGMGFMLLAILGLITTLLVWQFSLKRKSTDP